MSLICEKKLLQKQFEDQFLRLNELSKKNDVLFEKVKNHLGIAKSNGTSLIGNPLIKLENKIITLKYLVLHHQMNFEVYRSEILYSPDYDRSMSQQLAGMYEVFEGYNTQFLTLKAAVGKIITDKKQREYAISA